MKERAILLKNVSFISSRRVVLNDIDFHLNKGESTAICGVSGSGKTTLAKLIAGYLKPSNGLVQNDLKTQYVSQQDDFSELSGLPSNYYSKRYEFHDYEKQISVAEFLKNCLRKSETSTEDLDALLVDFKIENLLSKNLLALSNGERKKLQFVVAFLDNPELLVLDQPFTGLDPASRKRLSSIFEKMYTNGVSFVIICGLDEIPPFVEKAIVLENGQIKKEGKPNDFQDNSLDSVFKPSFSAEVPFRNNSENFKTIVEMQSVSVTMKGKSILSDINWRIESGECWALLGHNGAGKSTLLSLITADNPQGYNNYLILFDKQRGSGESIWDIKQKIGFLSPELHIYFMRGKGVLNTVPNIHSQSSTYSRLTGMDVVLSGYNDEVGTLSKPSKLQEEMAERWLKLVGLPDAKYMLFVNASLGEQRVLLLLRALIKNPALLILDEPCQGMDSAQINYFTSLLDYICTEKKVTMIYVSHKPEEIPACVDKVLTLKNGKVV
ncbi:ATP-binding cassette domain-containing protein [Galbibacter mesophilus]|uniref:ATP-binding cassette domain-containing protein n=1 Tax=Galbibacter mesophilus TaxID=379069 RepID=UPI00191F3BAE|nr:ATP-binding cassette domain-containing protein [Galbibacter mesophilus]MCM5664161.1 ATP-binding cassette domain-containing protein [Galbibacter mesophilus]